MLFKALLVALLLFVIFNLFQALYYMVKNDEQQPYLSKFLGRRLLFSVFIVLCVLLAVATGIITPHQRPY
jgi:branched-subunit amino acid transport protein AzlD